MKTKFLFFLLVFLMGCSSYDPLVVYKTVEKNVCENNTIKNETIRYINTTIPCNETIYVNETVYVNESCRFEEDYVLELIRRVKFLENRLDDNFNITIEYELDDCKDKLSECNETIDELRDLLD